MHHRFRFRFLYDVSYYVIISVVMINMIAGIIIDSFGELRDVYNRAQEDKATRCFVCGVNAAEFNRRASGFDKHVMSQHNMWHYLFFRHYLRKKVRMASPAHIPAASSPPRRHHHNPRQ